MIKIKRPPKNTWKIGDVASFGGIVGRIVANDPNLGGYPLFWITTEQGVDYGSSKKGMLVKFDLDGKFQSWHKEPLLSFIRRPKKAEINKDDKPRVEQLALPNGSEIVVNSSEPKDLAFESIEVGDIIHE